MSQTVETQFGTGTVVDREAVRGRVSYKVEGHGFSAWIEASAMPLDFQWMPGPDDIQDNSTILPYNPAPQSWTNPAEQNIQPGQKINPQKRTAPADSVTLQEESENYLPGPNSKLFAQSNRTADYDHLDPNSFSTNDGIQRTRDLNLPAMPNWEEEELSWADDPVREAATGGLDPEDIQAKLGPKYVNAFQEHDFTSLQARLDENAELVMAEYKERVSELVMAEDQEYLERVGRNEFLESSDPQIREAAWKDVRAKATRLRRSGQVMTRAANPDVIAAQVTGDHGTYEVMVFRSNYFTGSSAVDSWSCECPWGKWAFKREFSFVGRLCSHAYASLLELQALGKSKAQNPVYRNQPGIAFDPSQMRNRRSPRRRSSITAGFDIQVGDSVVHKDHSDISGTVAEDSDGQYLIEGGPGGEFWIDHADAVMVFEGSRTAEIVDLRPVGWDPYSRGLMNELHELWEEGSRPGKQKQRNEEIRELVTELRDRGFAVDGIMASLKEGFIDRPLGYGDIPDYGTSAEYVIEHELDNREDVTEPEFEYEAGGDHGTVRDLNDGGGEKRGAAIPRGTKVRYVKPNGAMSSQFGQVWEDHRDGDRQVLVRWDGRLDDEYVDPQRLEIESSRQADYSEDYQNGEPPAYGSGDEFGGDENPYYVDPAEQQDWEDPLPESEDDIVANFQRNAGHLLGGTEGFSSGGMDDIAAAASAHLKTAGRNFTMAEQQALIDEDDGQPYDRSGLRLDGTHYMGGF